MDNKNEEENQHTDPHMSNFAFKILTLMHDNPIVPIFRNPNKLLKRAGLKPGQKVLEVGCGPGFFTIPAAAIVGDKGLIYAVDIHPLAIKRVNEKIQQKGIQNISPILTNASDTDLADQSIDLAFLFGLQYIAGGLENVISEIYRILIKDGVFSFEKTRGSEKKLIEEIVSGGFVFSGKQGRIFSFVKAI